MTLAAEDNSGNLPRTTRSRGTIGAHQRKQEQEQERRRRNSNKSDDDPTTTRDQRFVGKFTLQRKESPNCPFFIQEFQFVCGYNADNDLIIHMTGQVAPIRKLYKTKYRNYFSKPVDGGFAKVDPTTGIFRCVHTPANRYFQLVSTITENVTAKKKTATIHDSDNNNAEQEEEPSTTTTTNSNNGSSRNLDGNSSVANGNSGLGAELDLVQYKNGKPIKSFRFKRTSTATF